MKTIQLARGHVALVDDEDFERVSAHSWFLSLHKGSKGPHVSGKVGGKVVSLHRFILNAQPGTKVDHVNRNGLDNRKENLRFATDSQNGANKGKVVYRGRGNTSKYKGVCWDKRYGAWMARVSRQWLGWYESEEHAARAYDIAAVERFGDFALTNGIDSAIVPERRVIRVRKKAA